MLDDNNTVGLGLIWWIMIELRTTLASIYCTDMETESVLVPQTYYHNANIPRTENGAGYTHKAPSMGH